MLTDGLPDENFLAEKASAIRSLAKNVMRDVVEIGRHLSEAKERFEAFFHQLFAHPVDHGCPRRPRAGNSLRAGRES